jgi:hypothetical protein
MFLFPLYRPLRAISEGGLIPPGSNRLTAPTLAKGLALVVRPQRLLRRRPSKATLLSPAGARSPCSLLEIGCGDVANALS